MILDSLIVLKYLIFRDNLQLMHWILYILSSGATVNQSYGITADIIIFIITKNNLIQYISLLI